MLRAQHLVRPLFSSSFVTPGRSLLPSRPYFRTPCLAAIHKSRPKSKAAARPKLTSPVPPSRATEAASESAPPHEEDFLPREEDFRPPEEDLRSPNSTRNHVFFAGFVGFNAFLCAAVKTNTETDELVEKIAGYGPGGVDNRTLMLAKTSELVQTLKKWGTLVVEKTQSLPEIPRTVIREAYANAAMKYINTPDAVKVCWGICAFNGAVFLAWRITPLAGFMARNFVHRPLSGMSRTLLTSVFAHISFWHLLFNSMALLSFGTSTGYYLKNEQAKGASNRLEASTGYHFLAFFIAAGVFSSLASHMLRIRLYDRAVSGISKLGQSAVRPYVGGSIGASGAIYATVTLTALAFPQTHVSPIFVPIEIPIQLGVGGLVLLDLVGLFRGWRVFDHIGHLGGAVFGVWYYLYGPRLWDSWRAFAGSMFGDKPRDVEREV